MQKYDVPDEIQLTNSNSERDIILRIAERENNIALEEDAQYMIQLSVPFEETGLAIHFTDRILDISIADPDCELVY